MEDDKPRRLPRELVGFTEAECRSCNAVMPVAVAHESACPACGHDCPEWCKPFGYEMDLDFFLVLGGIPAMILGLLASIAMLSGEIEFDWLGPLSGVLGLAAFALGLEIADRRWSKGRLRGRKAYGKGYDVR